MSLVVLGVVAFLSILGMLQIVNPKILTDWMQLKLTLNNMGFSGALSYLLMVAILPLFSPIALIVVTGSAAFGPIKCFFLSYTGCLINAAITFFLVKALFLEKAWEDGRRSLQVKKSIRHYGFFMVMCLQLISIIPFTLINVLATGSGMSWKKFIKANCIGIVPAILLYSFVGGSFATEFISPRIYFAGVFVMALLFVVMALRKKGFGKVVVDPRQKS